MLFINPSNFTSNNYTKKLRGFLLQNITIDKLILLKEDVFDASVNTCILVLIKNKMPQVIGFYDVSNKATFTIKSKHKVQQENYSADDLLIPIIEDFTNQIFDKYPKLKE